MNGGMPGAGAVPLGRRLLGWSGALAGGLLACLALMLGIRLLVTVDGGEPLAVPDRQALEFVRLPPPPPAAQRHQQPEPPARPDQPPPAPSMPALAAPEVAPVALSPVAMPEVAAFDVDGSGFNLGQAQAGEFLPLVKIAPVYPSRALNRGVEGDCTVSYTVTQTGAVTDVQVVPGACDSYLFEEASIEVAKRFRYQPRIIGGEAVAVRGVRNVFEFRLQE